MGVECGVFPLLWSPSSLEVILSIPLLQDLRRCDLSQMSDCLVPGSHILHSWEAPPVVWPLLCEAATIWGT